MQLLIRSIYMLVSVTVIMMAAGCDKKDKDLQFSGTLEMTEYQIGAKVPGQISTLTVEEGDTVKAGQVIATLDRHAQSKKDLDRTAWLYKQGGANLQTVEYARLNEADLRVTAPIDGVVLVKVRENGEIVSAGAPVVVLGDPKDQWVKIFIPEGKINRIQIGQKAVLSFDGTNRTYQGHVRYIATKAEFTPRNVQTAEERVTQAFAVKVALDAEHPAVHTGVAVDVKFDTDE